MDPVTLGLLAFLGLGLAAGKKKRRRPAPVPAEPCSELAPNELAPYGWTDDQYGNCVPALQPMVLWEGESWMIPDSWWGYVTPKLQMIVMPMIEAEVPVDPLPVAWELLMEETGPFPLPPTPYPPEGEFWQTDVSISPDFYAGPESVIGLMYHIADHVTAAVDRWEGGGDLYLGT